MIEIIEVNDSVGELGSSESESEMTMGSGGCGVGVGLVIVAKGTIAMVSPVRPLSGINLTSRFRDIGAVSGRIGVMCQFLITHRANMYVPALLDDEHKVPRASLMRERPPPSVLRVVVVADTRTVLLLRPLLSDGSVDVSTGAKVCASRSG